MEDNAPCSKAEGRQAYEELIEGATFPRTTLDNMLDAALAACDQLFVVQREALELPYPGELPEPKSPPKKAFGS